MTTVLAQLAVSPDHAAHMLDIKRTKVYELMKSGDLVFFRLGRHRRIPVAAIEEYVQKQLDALNV